jgi:putative thiamine transport system substrate-binding protein
MAALTPADLALFNNTPRGPATLSPAELGPTLLEPHATWMTQISAEWSVRYGIAQ